MKTLIVLFSLVFSFTTLCFQEATVVAKHAVIYSDTSLDTPLGYVKKGKSLFIGDKKKRKGKIIAVALVGRIGWIKTQDIKIRK